MSFKFNPITGKLDLVNNGTITGTGTTNTVPIWTSSTAIGNSVITQDATTKDVTVDNGTTTITIGDPASGSAVQNNTPSGNLVAQGNFYDFIVYAYFVSGSYIVFSANPLDLNMTDDGSNNTFDINLSWSAVPGATGYKVYVNEDDYTPLSGVIIDVGNTLSYTYNAVVLTFQSNPISTPPSPATVPQDTLKSNGNITSKDNIKIGQGGSVGADGGFAIADTTGLRLSFMPSQINGVDGQGVQQGNIGAVGFAGFNGFVMENTNDFGGGYGLCDFAWMARSPGGSIFKGIRLECRPGFTKTGTPELQFGDTDFYQGGFGLMPNMWIGGQYMAITTGLSIGQGMSPSTPPTNGLTVVGNTGIGTSTPRGIFDVQDSTGQNAYIDTDGDTNIGDFSSNNTGAYAKISPANNLMTLGGTGAGSGGSMGLTVGGATTFNNQAKFANQLVDASNSAGTPGQILSSTGSAISWIPKPTGTVTSVSGSGGTTGLTLTGGPITTSGTLTLGGTLAVANGGTANTSQILNGVLYAATTSSLTTSNNLKFDGTNLTLGSSGAVTAGSLTGFVLGAGSGTIIKTDISGQFLVNNGNGGNYIVVNSSNQFILQGTMIANARNIQTDTTTGTKIGTATTQKLGFFNSTPVVQQTGNVITALSNLGLVTSGTFPAASITGTLPLANGGTGSTTLLGAGIISIVNTVSLTGQVADITTTNLTTTGNLLRVSYSLQDTAADITAGAVVLTISYTDGAGATTSTATQVLTGTGRQSGTIYIQRASGNVTYATSHTGLFGTAQYALYITTELLN